MGQIMHRQVHAIVFIVSICCLFIAAAGYMRPLLSEPGRPARAADFQVQQPELGHCRRARTVTPRQAIDRPGGSGLPEILGVTFAQHLELGIRAVVTRTLAVNPSQAALRQSDSARPCQVPAQALEQEARAAACRR